MSDKMKPALFKDEMVCAVLDGRKTVTRRVVKDLPECDFKYLEENPEVCLDGDLEKTGVLKGLWATFETHGEHAEEFPMRKAAYRSGDVLWVREAGMMQSMKAFGHKVKMIFKADNSLVEFAVSDKEYNRLSKWALLQRWLSPYWLTKETARIFLRVTGVRVERLIDISNADVIHEGCAKTWRQNGCKCNAYFDGCMIAPCANRDAYESECHKIPFAELWDSTIKPADRDKYGWNANPWVWVIEFERCGKDGVAV